MDKNLANIQANSVPGVFSVVNHLEAPPSKSKKKKSEPKSETKSDTTDQTKQ